MVLEYVILVKLVIKWMCIVLEFCVWRLLVVGGILISFCYWNKFIFFYGLVLCFYNVICLILLILLLEILGRFFIYNIKIYWVIYF